MPIAEENRPCFGVERTDGQRLNLDAVLNVRGIGVVRLLVGQDRLAAEGVYKGRPA